jgi:hypothetical protein
MDFDESILRTDPMAEKTQDPMTVPPLAPASGFAETPKAEPTDEEKVAKQELERIMPSKEELRKFAAECGPLPKWLDEDEPPPF